MKNSFLIWECKKWKAFERQEFLHDPGVARCLRYFIQIFSCLNNCFLSLGIPVAQDSSPMFTTLHSWCHSPHLTMILVTPSPRDTYCPHMSVFKSIVLTHFGGKRQTPQNCICLILCSSGLSLGKSYNAKIFKSTFLFHRYVLCSKWDCVVRKGGIRVAAKNPGRCLF